MGLIFSVNIDVQFNENNFSALNTLSASKTVLVNCFASTFYFIKVNVVKQKLCIFIISVPVYNFNSFSMGVFSLSI